MLQNAHPIEIDCYAFDHDFDFEKIVSSGPSQMA